MNFKVNYGIILLKVGDLPLFEKVLHFVGYPKQPSDIDFIDLWKELSTDNELGWVGNLEGVELVEAPDKVVEQFCEIIDELE